MRSKSVKLTLISWVLLFIFSCVTINIYFPEAKVEKAAEEIVDDVRGSKDEDKEKKDHLFQEKKTKDGVISQLYSFSFIPAAYAQKAEEVSNPKIHALKESLRMRFPKLRPFFDREIIGETNNGFIRIMNESGLTLRERAVLRKSVKNENRDRENLYAEVGRALNIDSSQLPRIQKIFAERWIMKARPGWWIQKQNGEWIRKPGAF